MVENQNMIAPSVNPRPNNAINLEKNNTVSISNIDQKLPKPGKNLSIKHL